MNAGMTADGRTQAIRLEAVKIGILRRSVAALIARLSRRICGATGFCGARKSLLNFSPREKIRHPNSLHVYQNSNTASQVYNAKVEEALIDQANN
jgi:hypothetical protein